MVIVDSIVSGGMPRLAASSGTLRIPASIVGLVCAGVIENRKSIDNQIHVEGHVHIQGEECQYEGLECPIRLVTHVCIDPTHEACDSLCDCDGVACVVHYHNGLLCNYNELKCPIIQKKFVLTRALQVDADEDSLYFFDRDTLLYTMKTPEEIHNYWH